MRKIINVLFSFRFLLSTEHILQVKTYIAIGFTPFPLCDCIWTLVISNYVLFPSAFRTKCVIYDANFAPFSFAYLHTYRYTHRSHSILPRRKEFHIEQPFGLMFKGWPCWMDTQAERVRQCDRMSLNGIILQAFAASARSCNIVTFQNAVADRLFVHSLCNLSQNANKSRD